MSGPLLNADYDSIEVEDSDSARETVHPQQDVCGKCHRIISIGDFPFCPHGRVSANYGNGFSAYFDYGLGERVTGWGDIRKAMRENHLDYRDHPSPGETSARRDRIREQQRKAAGR